MQNTRVTSPDQLSSAVTGTQVLHGGSIPMLYTKQANGTWAGDSVNSYQRGLRPEQFTRSISSGLLSWSDGRVVLVKAL